MPFNLGAAEVEGDCPKCGRKFKEPLRRFEAQDTITCAGCGEQIALVLENPGDLRRAQKATDDLRRSFDGLAKRFDRLGER